jgi:hypothetical protein
MRDDVAGRTQILKPGSREFDAGSLKANYAVEGTRLEGLDASAVNGGTEFKAVFEIQARAQGKRSVFLAVKLWFRSMTPDVVQAAAARIRDRVGSILARWRGSDVPLPADLAREMRREMRDVTKKRPTLQIEIRQESGDSHLVELELAPSSGGS